MKTLMKKIACVSLAAMMMAIGLSACGGSTAGTSEDLMDKVVAAGELVVTLNTGNSP